MAKNKTPKEASQLFENIMKASVKPKTMTEEEANTKTATLQNMVNRYYIFNEGVGKVIAVRTVKVSDGNYDTMADGELESIQKKEVFQLASTLQPEK